MTVHDLRLQPVSEWIAHATELLSSENHWLHGVGPGLALDATRRTIEALVGDERVSILSHTGAHGIDAIAAVGESKWDCEHFGFPVHKLYGFATARGIANQDRVAKALVAEGIIPLIASAELVMARVSLSAVPELSALESAGFRLMDVQVMWMHQRAKGHPAAMDAAIRAATIDDTRAMSAIARETMREAPTHFHLDSRLAADRVDALYEGWAANSVAGTAADYVLVAELDGEIAGFTTAKLANTEGTSSARYGIIPLVAVAAGFRGRGVGRRLVSAALAWLDHRGAAASCIGTQANNFRGAALYAALGLRPVSAAVSMHRWRDDGDVV
jgi:dTDP-4-amino-4,6-dideoxy-D-galactose acyltransferase